MATWGHVEVLLDFLAIGRQNSQRSCREGLIGNGDCDIGGSGASVCNARAGREL